MTGHDQCRRTRSASVRTCACRIRLTEPTIYIVKCDDGIEFFHTQVDPKGQAGVKGLNPDLHQDLPHSSDALWCRTDQRRSRYARELARIIAPVERVSMHLTTTTWYIEQAQDVLERVFACLVVLGSRLAVPAVIA